MASVGHAFAAVEGQDADEIRFIFELFDEVAVGAGIDLPVDLPNIVPWRILAMLCEFDRLSARWASMHTGDIAIDQMLATQ